MLFASYAFLLIFLPIVLATALRLRGQALLVWLVLSSAVFYGLEGDWWFLIPMVATTLWDYWMALRIDAAERPAAKRRFLAISLGVSLGTLCLFKYGRLMGETVVFLTEGSALARYAAQWTACLPSIVPAGISFYTFQTMAYVIDVYRGDTRPEKNIWKFAGFVSFFPHLVAGPLTRHDQLLEPLGRIAAEGIAPRWREGIFLFAIGLCKKELLADRLGDAVNVMLSDPASLGVIGGWAAAIAFGMQIYFDFGAYTDMAIGLGRLFGVELPPNFNDPYKAANPSDFWRRWHMTLSYWIRDYLFTPLCARWTSTGGALAAILLTMFAAGLWHGARWGYAVWGLYHGALLVLYYLLRDRWDAMPLGLQRVATFLLVSVGWIFFRSPSLRTAGDWFLSCFGRYGGGNPGSQPLLPWVVFVLFPICFYSMYRFPTACAYQGWHSLPAASQVVLGILTALALLYMNYPSQFIYFQF